MNEDFFLISDILNDSLFGSNKRSAIRYSTIFSFWAQIVGKKFANSTKPSKIKGSKLYVSCENPFVVQEMIMYKKILLNKIRPYSSPLGVDIDDMVFDYKSWSDEQEISTVDDFPKFYDDKELDLQDVDCSEFEKVFLNIDNSPYLNDEQKDKFKNRIIKLQKAKKLRNS